MKKRTAAICILVLLLGGCAKHEAAPKIPPVEIMELPSLGQPGKSTTAVVLGDIWSQYEPQERFSIYGGTVENPVPDAPGDLDVQRHEVWTAHLHFPVDCLQDVQQGAVITHLLDDSLFVASVLRVSDQQKLLILAEDWRKEIQHSQWQTLAPQRLLLAQTGGQYLVLAMGGKEYVRTFHQKLMLAYPMSQVIFEEAVTS